MEKLLFIIFIFSNLSFAENSRSPAVMPESCNLNIPTTVMIKKNGKMVLKERSIQEVQVEQCREVKKCLNSASDEEFDELKKLEAVACKNKFSPLNTTAPVAGVDKNFDGKRDGKSLPSSEKLVAPDASTSIVK